MTKPVKLLLLLIGLTVLAWPDGDGRVATLDVAPRLLGFEVKLELSVERVRHACEPAEVEAAAHRPDGQEAVCD